MTDLDSVLEDVGPFGRYQKFLFVLLCVPSCLQTPFMAFNHIFVAATPDHWCKVPQLMNITGMTAADRKNLSIPLDDGDAGYRKCEMYAVDYETIIAEGNVTVANASWPIHECQYGWEYDDTYYKSTLVTEFDLVCKKNLWPSLCVSAFYAGGIPGLFLFGWLSDRFGRKISLRFVIMGVTLLSLASAFSIHYIMYLMFRFAIGLFFPAIYQVPYLITLEMTTTNYRPHVSMIPCILFGIGMATVAGVAWLFRHWTHLIIATSSPFILTFSYWWLIPESPRWLLSKGRFEEAENVILKTGKMNGYPAERGILVNNLRHESAHSVNQSQPEVLEEPENSVRYDKEDMNPTLLDLFTWPNIRQKTLIVSVIFSINAIVYTGISYMSINMGANDYSSFAVNAIVESPSAFMAWYTMEKWGRRWTISILMVLVGVVCISTISVPTEQAWIAVTLASVGKFCISATFAVIYVYGTELLPTVVRGAGLGFYSFVSTVFVCFSPFIVYTTVHSRKLPMVIMGALSAIAGAMTLLLPETVGKNLPQTLAEGEVFGKGLKPCRTRFFKRKVKDVKYQTKDAHQVKCHMKDQITDINGYDATHTLAEETTDV